MPDKKIIVSAKVLADVHNTLMATTQQGENLIMVANCIMALRQALDGAEEYIEKSEEENDKSDD